MQTSELKIYSLGQAAENLTIRERKDPAFGTLEVTPVEALNFLDGEIKSNPTQDKVSGVDATGAAVQTTVMADNSLTATWLPLEGHQHTPPDIRRGERVIIWRFANLPTFYWTELGLDRKYRKLETTVYSWNANPNESDDSQTAENHYWIEVSTHKGTITLQTSKANKEKIVHTLQLNPMEGKFTFMDDLGQAIYIDSIAHLIHLINADKSEVTLDKQVITVKCDDALNLTAAKTVNLTTDTLNIKAPKINVDSQTVHVTADTVTADCNTATISGVTISNGKITCGDINSSGKMTIAGITSSAPVTAPNIH